MTGSARSRVGGAGRVGLITFASLAFATFLLPSFSGGDERVIIGLDLGYVRHELPAGSHLSYLRYFLDVVPLPVYVGLLLARASPSAR